MSAVASNPATVNITLFILSFLLAVLIALLAFIGNGFNKRIDATQKRFEIVFEEFTKYRTNEICNIYRDIDKARHEKQDRDLNKLGAKVDKKNT